MKWLPLGLALLVILRLFGEYLSGSLQFNEIAAFHFEFAEKSWFFNSLREGRFPLLYPNNELGHVWLSNPASGLLFLPNWLLAIIPFFFAQKFIFLGHMVLLYFGLQRLFSIFKSTSESAWFAAACLSIGLIQTLPIHVTLGYFSFFPWAIYYVIKLWRGESQLPQLVISTSALFLLGDPFLIPAAWVFGSFIAFDHTQLSQVVKRFFSIQFWVALICLPHLYLMIANVTYNSRFYGIAPIEALSYSTSPIRILDWLFPWKTFYDVKLYIGQGLNSSWWFPRIGGGFILTGLMLLGAWRSKKKNVLLIWGLGFVVLSLGQFFAPSEWILTHLPILKSIRFPERFLMYALPAFLVLGYEGFTSVPKKWRWAVLLLVLGENLTLIHKLPLIEIQSAPQAYQQVWRDRGFQPTRWFVCDRGLQGNSEFSYYDLRALNVAMVNGTSNTRSLQLKSAVCPDVLSPENQRLLGITHVLVPNDEVPSAQYDLRPVAKIPSGGIVYTTSDASPLRAFGLPGKWNCPMPYLDMKAEHFNRFSLSNTLGCSGELSLPWATHYGWRVLGAEMLNSDKEAVIGLKISKDREKIELEYEPFGARELALFSLIIQSFFIVTIVAKRFLRSF